MAICDVWPDADVFTAVYDEEGTEGRFAHRPIHTSFLQRLRPTARTFRPLLPLYPYAIESFDLRGYDIVVSSSSAWAHGVIVDEGALHVCYCHNPFRYAWNARDETLRGRNGLGRAALRCCSTAGASGTGSRPSAWTATWPTRTSRRAASPATSAATPPCSTRRWRPSASRPARRRLLPGRLRAHAAQADRRRGGGVRPPRAAAGGRGRRPRRPPPAPHRPGQHRLRGPRHRRARGRAARGRPGAGGDRDRGVRDRRGRGAGRRPPGDRLRRGRRARDRARGRDRHALPPVPTRGAGRGRAPVRRRHRVVPGLHRQRDALRRPPLPGRAARRSSRRPASSSARRARSRAPAAAAGSARSWWNPPG